MDGIPGRAWLWFVVGSLLIGGGGVMGALGWHVLSGQWEKAQGWGVRLAVGSACLVPGALLVGGGGCLTTRGWSLVEQQERLKAHLIAIAQEWDVNDMVLSKCPLFTSDDERVLGKRTMFPRFKVSALNRALTSGLLRPASARDRSLLEVLTFYEVALSDVNEMLDLFDTSMARITDSAQVVESRRALREGKKLDYLRTFHVRLMELLKREYPQAWQERIRGAPTDPGLPDSTP